MEILFEDNHFIAVNKKTGDIIQGDKTGDEPLSSVVARHIAIRDNKPGDAFIGVPHRLDRPVSGVAIFAKRSKSLERINEQFRNGEVKKLYWAIVAKMPPTEQGELTHFLIRNEKQNRSYAYDKMKNGAKEARLRYKLIASSDNYFLLEIELLTGRHHQIRCQLSAIGCPIKGDLKYGAPRSNPDGGISLHARSVRFLHPVKKEDIFIVAEPPVDNIWNYFKKIATEAGF
ncbi:MAG: RNA pseudouridine synthase [Bacteroidetes bacterium GWE2_39_28]|nr:MAG: RNA pseudouridine synthase [Bacteroidetes bacterium GWE2_39_28]OFY13009.1 MAG: RNA pseudouridine synthase [Bacteroidetes bacterium GWF2_39_10]OFZ08131.1 MAG: RNA pseudouridine synthase [Bacteroidetes bacterium RIFOXYB2_FULL_39_7]OFZ11876.1 MAG: RNA pseudouridine synthase [Bacteroidetes bacterium RIFOXYC2_FULL_39_11]HCT94087.1 RNA pseudouridine synthase [Rikenellaceae bacterium]